MNRISGLIRSCYRLKRKRSRPIIVSQFVCLFVDLRGREGNGVVEGATNIWWPKSPQASSGMSDRQTGGSTTTSREGPAFLGETLR